MERKGNTGLPCEQNWWGSPLWSIDKGHHARDYFERECATPINGSSKRGHGVYEINLENL